MSVMILAGNVWFYWLAWVLIGGAVGGVVFTLIGYYVKVARHKVNRITKN